MAHVSTEAATVSSNVSRVEEITAKPELIRLQSLASGKPVKTRSIDCVDQRLAGNKMTSWTTLQVYGLLCWMATIIAVSNADCDVLFKDFPDHHGCNCSLSNQTGLLLTDCEKDVKLNLPKLYRPTHFKSMIAIRNSTGINLTNDDNETVMNEMREVSLILSDITNVYIGIKAFDQVIVNIVFNNVGKLNLMERSFSSCWGTAWIVNSSITASTMGGFSGNDMVVYKDTDFSFTIHSRLKVTPRQKFKLVYHLADKMDDLEITIFAILALLGAIVLTLIGLTIVVATKSTQSRSNAAFGDLPDVVPAPSQVPFRKKVNNPVTKVSRMSRAIFSKTNARDKVEPKVPKRREQTRNPRPPLAIPVHAFESY